MCNRKSCRGQFISILEPKASICSKQPQYCLHLLLYTSQMPLFAAYIAQNPTLLLWQQTTFYITSALMHSVSTELPIDYNKANNNDITLQTKTITTTTTTTTSLLTHARSVSGILLFLPFCLNQLAVAWIFSIDMNYIIHMQECEYIVIIVVVVVVIVFFLPFILS